MSIEKPGIHPIERLTKLMLPLLLVVGCQSQSLESNTHDEIPLQVVEAVRKSNVRGKFSHDLYEVDGKQVVIQDSLGARFNLDGQIVTVAHAANNGYGVSGSDRPVVVSSNDKFVKNISFPESSKVKVGDTVYLPVTQTFTEEPRDADTVTALKSPVILTGKVISKKIDKSGQLVLTVDLNNSIKAISNTNLQSFLWFPRGLSGTNVVNGDGKTLGVFARGAWGEGDVPNGKFDILTGVSFQNETKEPEVNIFMRPDNYK